MVRRRVSNSRRISNKRSIRESKKNLCEGVSSITPIPGAKQLPDDMLTYLLDSGMELEVVDEDYPLPFNVSLASDGSTFKISGAAFPDGQGKCEVSIPIRSVSKYVKFVFDDPVDMDKKIADNLLKLGWKTK